jgi:hypothetical protein
VEVGSPDVLFGYESVYGPIGVVTVIRLGVFGFGLAGRPRPISGSKAARARCLVVTTASQLGEDRGEVVLVTESFMTDPYVVCGV